jgi:uncharacterized membrane protein required for colicin V production
VIDLIGLAIFVLLVVRGWRRGFVRQALDVATLLLGVALAFRLAPIVGRMMSDTFGWSPELARVVGGAMLFLALSVGAGFLSSAIHGSMKRLPGTSLLNSAGGAGLGGVYALVLAVAAITLLAAIPLPAAVAAELEESKIAAQVVDADGPAQRAVEAVSGDRAVQSIIALRRLADDWLLVATEDDDRVLPGSGSGDARPSTKAASAVVASVDRVRAELGLAPFQWSDDLEIVAVARASAIYRTGSFTAMQPLHDRLGGAGIDTAESAERLVLAPTVEGAGRAIDSTGSYDRAGVGVVDGPYGLMVVLVLVGDA